jgi:hypothetical protein
VAVLPEVATRVTDSAAAAMLVAVSPVAAATWAAEVVDSMAAVGADSTAAVVTANRF